MFEVEKRAHALSKQYYNRGLDRAQIRDLSGAADMLRRSLELDKRNIQARNLLGLVYFEIGEAVSALSEWVISKNLQEEGNIAGEYIRKLQSNQNKLSAINQSVKAYNQALHSCKRGDEDIAAIQLKKAIGQNPKLIKAYHLLCLIYIQKGKLGRARRYLKRALKIDQTNSTTLRYLKEIELQLNNHPELQQREKELEGDGDQRMQIVNFHERSPMVSTLNILVGLAVGVLAAWILITPVMVRSAEEKASRKMVEYNNTIAAQQEQIDAIRKEADQSDSDKESASKKVTETQETTDVYEALLKAYKSYQDGNSSAASQMLQSVNKELLSTDGKLIYEQVYGQVKTVAFKQLKNAAMEAYAQKDYATAVDKLEQAREIDGDDYPVLDYLALAYQAAGNKEKSIEIFKLIVEKFPNTRRANTAKEYIRQMGGTVE